MEANFSKVLKVFEENKSIKLNFIRKTYKDKSYNTIFTNITFLIDLKHLVNTYLVHVDVLLIETSPDFYSTLTLTSAYTNFEFQNLKLLDTNPTYYWQTSSNTA